MRKRTWANLYFASYYVSTFLLIVLALVGGLLWSLCGNWTYGILVAATIIWFMIIKRLFRLRPKRRPGVWTQEMEVERHRSMNKRWREQAVEMEVDRYFDRNKPVNPPAPTPDAQSESN